MSAFTEERTTPEVCKKRKTHVRGFSFLFLRVTDQAARLLHCTDKNSISFDIIK